MNIFSEESVIRFSNIDQSDTLTMASTFDLFQEAAMNHAEILGVGREAMMQSGNVWILSRLSVFMTRRPRFREKIVIRTWPRNANKLFAVRDYDIHYSSDNSGIQGGLGHDTALVQGRSGWLVVDIEKRRPLRPQAAVENLPPNEGINALPGENLAGNDPPPSLAVRDFSAAGHILRRACYSDIDYNGHVNNARYIQWIQDLLDPVILDNAKQIRLDINYLAEVLYDEIIGLFLLPIETENVPDDSPLCGQTPRPCTAAFAIEGRRFLEARQDPEEAIPVFRAELRTG
ncbi:MAG: thioesterase [Treponema sp.]|nr:thioesterase [Treponema sp.]